MKSARDSYLSEPKETIMNSVCAIHGLRLVSFKDKELEETLGVTEVYYCPFHFCDEFEYLAKSDPKELMKVPHCGEMLFYEMDASAIATVVLFRNTIRLKILFHKLSGFKLLGQ